MCVLSTGVADGVLLATMRPASRQLSIAATRLVHAACMAAPPSCMQHAWLPTLLHAACMVDPTLPHATCMANSPLPHAACMADPSSCIQHAWLIPPSCMRHAWLTHPPAYSMHYCPTLSRATPAAHPTRWPLAQFHPQ
eukprot:134856-Chlamydomonas_euryale.AAC.1